MDKNILDKLDPELKTYYAEVKDEVKKVNNDYIANHPEIRELLNDFLSTLLSEKPDDVYTYAQEHFKYFNITVENQQQPAIVIAGPHCVGKSAIAKALQKKYPNILQIAVPYTTRKPRDDEAQGKDVNFISKEQFMDEITLNSFMEYTESNGIMYGTHKSQYKNVVEDGKICIIETTFKGAEKLEKSGVEAHYIWVDPPNMGDLKDRIKASGVDTEEGIEKTAEIAQTDMKEAKKAKIFEKYMVNRSLNDFVTRFTEYLSEAYPAVTFNS